MSGNWELASEATALEEIMLFFRRNHDFAYFYPKK